MLLPARNFLSSEPKLAEDTLLQPLAPFYSVQVFKMAQGTLWRCSLLQPTAPTAHCSHLLFPAHTARPAQTHVWLLLLPAEFLPKAAGLSHLYSSARSQRDLPGHLVRTGTPSPHPASPCFTACTPSSRRPVSQVSPSENVSSTGIVTPAFLKRYLPSV